MKTIIFDCDPGIDDALALLSALKSDDAELKAITTVAGNVTVEKATRNVYKVLSLLGRERDVEISIGAGAAKPLVRMLKTSEYFHGYDGLGDTEDLFEDLAFEDLLKRVPPAVDLIIDTITKNPQPTTLVTTGPLTNLASAVEKEPKIASKMERVVVMGGAVRVPGNVTMAAEFNIYCDPDAAKIVFNSKLPLTLVSLDVTTKEENTLTLNHLSEIEKADTKIARFVSRIIRHCMKASKRVLHIEGCYLHDPLALAIAMDEKLIIKSEKIYVDVETEGEVTLGKTQADLCKYSQRLPNLTHCVEVDSERFLDSFIRSLRTSY